MPWICKLVHKDLHLDKSGIGVTWHSVWEHSSKGDECLGLFAKVNQMLKKKEQDNI